MSILNIHFLDVGQGDGTFIVFPSETETMLVDLGSKKNADAAGGDAIKFITNELRRIGRDKIDYLFVTHGDGDHYNLLPELVSAIPTLTFGSIYIGGQLTDYPKTLRDNVFAKGHLFPPFPFGAHDPPNHPRWTVDGVKIYLLGVNNPGAPGRTPTNSSSIVLMLDYNGKVILPGDAEDNVENVIVRTNYSSNPAFLHSGVLKLGHHGSKNATKRDWITAVNPRAIFASADRKWSHPYSAVINRFKTARPLSDTSNPAGLDGNTTLVQLYDHQIVSGTTGDRDYHNSRLKSAVFTNIFFIHTAGPFKGQVLGTQYRLELDGAGNFSVNDLHNTSIWFIS